MIRVFPRRTKWTPDDELAVIGDPPLPGLLPAGLPVRISVAFTWDFAEGQRLLAAWSRYYEDVEIGGPAFNSPAGEFTPGLFIKRGVTITSRGCRFRCPWCLVPTREGELRELSVEAGWIVQDNNLLACSRDHVEAVIEMLKGQARAAVFAGGLDKRLLYPWHVDLFRKIRIEEMWFALDSDDSETWRHLERAADLLGDFRPRQKRCYVLIGFNKDTVERARARLENVYRLGFWPFAMLYQPPFMDFAGYNPAWRDLARTWTRPAAFKTKMGKAI